MKTNCCTIVCLMALGLASTLAQQPAPPPRPLNPASPAPAPTPPPGDQFSSRPPNITGRTHPAPPPEPGLTKFSLDFPGGDPGALVAAIQKATGKPLNAIIPDAVVATKLPPLKMSNVDVAQLFQALGAASRKSEAVISSTFAPYGSSPSYTIADTSCGFRQGSEGRPTDETIWYFYVQKPALAPFAPSAKVCRFYSLAPYLDRGVSVDDITTAIETGWKMLGDTSPPAISFHKDTKLLIAVGEPSKLETIDAVLKALDLPKPPPGTPTPSSPFAKPREKPTTAK